MANVPAVAPVAAQDAPKRDPWAPYASDGQGGVMLAVGILAVPHRALSPNARVDPRSVAKHRKALREAAYLATHNLLIAYPWVEERLRHGRLRLIYTVCWPRGRQHWDGDNLGAALKGATDGFAQKLGIDDAGFAFLPVSQRSIDDRQGWTCLVAIEEAPTDGA